MLPMNFHWFFILFVICFSVHEIIEIGLTLLNRAHTRRHVDEIPEFFRDKTTPENYAKSVAYTLDKEKFALVTRLFNIVFLWALILSGFFQTADAVTGWLKPGLTHSLVYCFLFGSIFLIMGIPFSLYSHFIIEKKYGFNKMTLTTFLGDQLKTIFLGLLFGIPLLVGLFWFYQATGKWWWIYAVLAVFGFEMLVAAIYPVFLAPLFNKFTPLEEGTLKEGILNIAKKIGFKLSGIYTIDGSKRSNHSNAYFAGLGRWRRIVLFDTLQKQMTEREILAILGHEMGHNIKRHVQKQLALSFVISLFSFWALSLAIGWDPFYAAFGAGSPAPHKALVLMALFLGVFTFWLPPLTNYLSRKYEYEADRFSLQAVGDREAMKSSLIKLSKENLSNLTPHPLYTFYHYTHPTTIDRIKALNR